MTKDNTMNEQAVLNVFEEAGLEVTLVHDTDAVPRDSQALVACQYKGRHRMVHPEACKWHQDHADTSCKGCPRVIQKQAQTPQVQHKLFA